MCSYDLRGQLYLSDFTSEFHCRGLKRKNMEIIKIKDDFIKLGQLLKLAGMCDSGVDAKHAIAQGLVKVNGETELQRGKKIRDKDVVTYHGKSIQIEG